MSEISIDVKPSGDRIGKAFQDIWSVQALQKAINRFAFSIERESKKVTPVRTGRLRGSIATDFGNLRATIRPNTSYAGFVHWGTRFMAARPYMSWGVQIAMRDEDVFNDELRKEIEVNIQRI